MIIKLILSRVSRYISIKMNSNKFGIKFIFVLNIILLCLTFNANAKSIETLRKDFNKLKFGMFIHFNMGTFHEKEWVDPGKDLNSFNPLKLDCNQWAMAAKSAGMKYAVLTTKHHDGFCLWDSEITDYDVASTPMKGRDIVREYCDAFRKAGIEPNIYFSIWDRSLGIEDSITNKDIALIKVQLKELLTNYGDFGFIIFDGWGNCGTKWTQKDYEVIYKYIKSLQPNILITDHYQLRRGIPLDDVYKKVDIFHYEEPFGEWAPEGNTYASQQGPCIQSEWFWKKKFPNEKLMSVDDIINKHLKVLNARNCNFLLNCAPNADGLMDDNVLDRLSEVGKAYGKGCNYYIDADKGSDKNDGLSVKKPWKSLSKVNSVIFNPGDSILFKSGGNWNGQLRPQGCGIEGAPIVISSYGKGKLPYITQGSLSGIVVLLQNQDYWEISNLEIDGGTDKYPEMVGGIHVQATDAGRVLKNILIRDCIIRNILGTVKLYESCAIWVGVPGWDDKNGLTTGFDDILIENNRIYKSDRNGILVWTTAAPGKKSQFQPGLIPSKNVVIRNNQIEDIGGDAILILGSDKPLIEHNVVRRCCLKSGNPIYGKDYNPSAAAIWLHHCENGIMQYNAVYDCLKLEKNNDGMAYDFDFNCNGNILQYNYSCNNAGGFLLIMNTATNNIARYNISENDRNHVLFCVGSKDENNVLYNNTFYLKDDTSYIIPNAHFINNIFMADSNSVMSVQKPELGVFENNCYGGNWKNIPSDKNAIIGNPKFVYKAKSKLDTSAFSKFVLQSSSNCIGKGKVIKNNGGIDIMGNKVTENASPNVGAVSFK